MGDVYVNRTDSIKLKELGFITEWEDEPIEIEIDI